MESRWRGLALAGAKRLLRVTLRPQPSDAAAAVHPLIDFRFAFETSDENRLHTRAFGQDVPVVLSISYGFENYFCFGHALLCNDPDRNQRHEGMPKLVFSTLRNQLAIDRGYSNVAPGRASFVLTCMVRPSPVKARHS